MRTNFLRVIFAAVIVTALSTASQAQIVTYTTILTGPNEAPPNASPGFGFATVTVNSALNTMRVQASFTGLTGTTTAAHIHAATAVPQTGTSGVATQTPSFTGFPLGVSSGVMDTTFDMTLAASFNATYVTNNGGSPATAFTALKAALDGKQAYFNVHTSTFGGGEIRGFLVAAPEPGTVGLLAMGLLIGAARLRRRSA
jgi:hypothetical protein